MTAARAREPAKPIGRSNRRRAADAGRRAAAALCPRAGTGGTCGQDRGALAAADEVGAEHVAEAISYRSPSELDAVNELALAAFAAETGSHVVEQPRERRFQRFSEASTARYLESLAERGLRFVGRALTAIPSSCASSTTHRRDCSSAVRRGAEVLRRPAVAIVGARACSSYGAQVARLLGRELAAAGSSCSAALHVASTAKRIEARSRPAGRRSRSSAAASTATIRPPMRNSRSESASEGLVASEYAPGVEPAPWRFPARNRIVAGLAAATVVVEARERSGALITADFALEDRSGGLRRPG